MASETDIQYSKWILIFVTIVLTISTSIGSVGAASISDATVEPTADIGDSHVGSAQGYSFERLHRFDQGSLSTTTTIYDTDQQSNAASTVYTKDDVTSNVATIRAHEVWSEYETRGDGVAVGMIDTGVDVESHPELAPIEGSWRDFVNNEPEPYDIDTGGHGTVTAGIVAGEQTNDDVYYGVAPETDLLIAQAAKYTYNPDSGQAEHLFKRDAMFEALNWFKNHPKKVDAISIQGSFDESGNPQAQRRYFDIFEELKDQGIVVIVGSGNEGEGNIYSPTNGYDTLSVGATDGEGNIADYSTGGVVNVRDTWASTATNGRDWPDEYVVPDVAAPGSGSRSATAGGGYDLYAGTSIAAPHVLGTVALMESATEEDLSPEEIETAIQSTAEHPNGENAEKDVRYGYGIIDAYEAVEAVAGEPATFTVQTTEYIAPSNSAEPHRFEATIKNTGDNSGTRPVSSVITVSESTNQFRQGDTQVTLDVNETKTITAAIDPQSVDSDINEVQWNIEIADTEQEFEFDITHHLFNRVPGFGLVSVIGALGGSGYILRKRLSE